MTERFDPARSDFRAVGERLRVREQIRKAERNAPSRGEFSEVVPLKRRCEGPGCNMSKSAFASTEEFEAHRHICENRR